ncbi:MAG: amino acid ABC transporter substrate-binding protein [Betaproteobacteria bacterium]
MKLAYRKVLGWAWVLGVAPAVALAQPAPPVVSKQPPTLEKIGTRGSIVLAHREASVPFSYVDQDKRPIGYSLDLCLRVVDAVRRALKAPALRVEYLPVPAAQRIPSIVEGRADLECGNTTNTAARRAQVAFTVTHYFAGGRLLVKSDSGIQRLADLGNRIVTTTSGSTHAAFIKQQVERGLLQVRLLEAKDSAEAFALLAEGKAAGFLMDDIVLYGLRATAADPKAFTVVGEFTTVEPLAIMLRRDDPEFKRLVDVTLSQLMIDGEALTLYRRWFEQPIPPKGITLGVPPSPLLREQFRFPSEKVGDALGG